MSAKKIQILSASDLLSGRVVYATVVGEWSAQLQEAALFDDPISANEALDRAMTDVSRVVSVELINAVVDCSGVSFPRYRDRFRAHGPTHRNDLSTSGKDFILPAT